MKEVVGLPGCPGCAALLERLRTLESRVRDLETQAKQNSRNSHKPPSSDPLTLDRPKKEKGERRRGGQPGHEGKTRDLLPIEVVDVVVDCRPEVCSGCGAALAGDDPDPMRFQVIEIPQLKGHVTEYRSHLLGCRCGVATAGTLPDGVREGSFGPRLQAAVAVLTGAYRLSKRNAQAMLQDFFGIEVALGSICNTEKVMSAALAEPVEAAQGYVQKQEVCHVDETGIREEGKKVWLWGAIAGMVATYYVRASRGSKVAKEILGELFSGKLVTDRWSAYTWVPVRRRQLCWAHLVRDFAKVAESGRKAAWIGTELGELAEGLFKHWHRIRDGTLKRSTFRMYAGEIRAEMRRLLNHGVALEHVDARTAGFCKELLKLEPAMWTFTRVVGVEPTNNAAERGLRHAVIWRKTSFGTQSKEGSRYVERILTAVGTLRLQKRNVLEYLVAARNAALQHTRAPSLLPVRVRR